MSAPVVRFLADDPMGLWRAGELATDLGPESLETPGLLLLRLHERDELIALTYPYERNLIERYE